MLTKTVLTQRLAALTVALALTAGACARSDGDTESTPDSASAATTAAAEPTTADSVPDEPTDSSAPTDTEPADGTDATTPTDTGATDTVPIEEAVGGLGDGDFGALKNVCSEAEVVPSDAQGVTDTQIQIGLVSDKGAEIRPGLNEEMYDTAVAFANWCNENGGLAGRELVIADRDAKLFEYNAAIQSACAEDFMLVGGGSVFDDADNGGRVACGLPAIQSFVVSDSARVADLQVQAIANPLNSISTSHLRATLAKVATPNVGVITPDLPSTQLVADLSRRATEQLGGNIVYNGVYGAGGEDNWSPFVSAMRQSEVNILTYIGEPLNMVALLKQMEQDEFYPEYILIDSNGYDEKLIAEARTALKNVYVRTIYHPKELAADNPPTQAYLDLLEQYNPGARVAQLGQQGLSNMLLFAVAVNECAADGITRECVIEAARVDEWTGGGMHAPTNPASGEAPKCALIMAATPDGFVYNEELTAPNLGLFNCDPLNSVTVDS